MNFSINVYKPESMRIDNYKKNNYYFDASMFNNEIPDTDKNVIANWVIYNYPTSYDSITDQIKKINKNIISRLDHNDDIISNLYEII